eukprot:6183377-Pleurochrysis_carterae.AAC.2
MQQSHTGHAGHLKRLPTVQWPKCSACASRPICGVLSTPLRTRSCEPPSPTDLVPSNTFEWAKPVIKSETSSWRSSSTPASNGLHTSMAGAMHGSNGVA